MEIDVYKGVVIESICWAYVSQWRLFYLEDGGFIFLRNVDNCLTVYTVLKSKDRLLKI